jgi:hypothetical protein
MNVIVVLSAVVHRGVTLSLDQVLFLLPSAIILLVQNLFDLILLLFINDIWGRFEVIGPMFRSFTIW